MTIEPPVREVEELLAEFGEDPGELFFEIELEEVECYRIMFISMWVDPQHDVVISNVVMDIEIPKEEIEPLA